MTRWLPKLGDDDDPMQIDTSNDDTMLEKWTDGVDGYDVGERVWESGLRTFLI